MSNNPHNKYRYDVCAYMPYSILSELDEHKDSPLVKELLELKESLYGAEGVSAEVIQTITKGFRLAITESKKTGIQFGSIYIMPFRPSQVVYDYVEYLLRQWYNPDDIIPLFNPEYIVGFLHMWNPDIESQRFLQEFINLDEEGNKFQDKIYTPEKYDTQERMSLFDVCFFLHVLVELGIKSFRYRS